MKTYTGKITELSDNQIFVFGSNPVGINGNPQKNTGGAALYANLKGWVLPNEKMHNKLSVTGKSWGLTTVSYPDKKKSKTENEILSGIYILYDYAKEHPEKEFLIAYDGLNPYKKNLNGYTSKEMANIFSIIYPPENIIFEENFWILIVKYYTMIRSEKIKAKYFRAEN